VESVFLIERGEYDDKEVTSAHLSRAGAEGALRAEGYSRHEPHADSWRRDTGQKSCTVCDGGAALYEHANVLEVSVTGRPPTAVVNVAHTSLDGDPLDGYDTVCCPTCGATLVLHGQDGGER
jgi:hypothetical protein